MPDQTPNTFERRARMYEDRAREQAERLAAARAEPPADSRDLKPEEVRQAWDFSPSPQPETDFWSLHSQALDSARQQGIERPEEAADAAAMTEVYPYRAKLVGMGTAPLKIAVQRAERLRRLIDRQEMP